LSGKIIEGESEAKRLKASVARIAFYYSKGRQPREFTAGGEGNVGAVLGGRGLISPSIVFGKV